MGRSPHLLCAKRAERASRTHLTLLAGLPCTRAITSPAARSLMQASSATGRAMPTMQPSPPDPRKCLAAVGDQWRFHRTSQALAACCVHACSLRPCLALTWRGGCSCRRLLPEVSCSRRLGGPKYTARWQINPFRLVLGLLNLLSAVCLGKRGCNNQWESDGRLSVDLIIPCQQNSSTWTGAMEIVPSRSRHRI